MMPSKSQLQLMLRLMTNGIEYYYFLVASPVATKTTQLQPQLQMKKNQVQLNLQVNSYARITMQSNSIELD
jgi:hypothetical protein